MSELFHNFISINVLNKQNLIPETNFYQKVSGLYFTFLIKLSPWKDHSSRSYFDVPRSHEEDNVTQIWLHVLTDQTSFQSSESHCDETTWSDYFIPKVKFIIPEEIWTAAGTKNTTVNTKTLNAGSKPSAPENQTETQPLPLSPTFKTKGNSTRSAIIKSSVSPVKRCATEKWILSF